jgi:hypothetical protein
MTANFIHLIKPRFQLQMMRQRNPIEATVRGTVFCGLTSSFIWKNLDSG